MPASALPRTIFGGLNDSGGAVATNASPTNLAWSVGAGLALSITPNFKIDVSYRHIDMGGIQSNRLEYCLNQPCFNERQWFHVASNDVRLGFRYVFLEPVAPTVVAAKY
jgi:opacity protein-like surface antigen